MQRIIMTVGGILYLLIVGIGVIVNTLPAVGMTESTCLVTSRTNEPGSRRRSQGYTIRTESLGSVFCQEDAIGGSAVANFGDSPPAVNSNVECYVTRDQTTQCSKPVSFVRLVPIVVFGQIPGLPALPWGFLVLFNFALFAKCAGSFCDQTDQMPHPMGMPQPGMGGFQPLGVQPLVGMPPGVQPQMGMPHTGMGYF
jgi:hypothetical protein